MTCRYKVLQDEQQRSRLVLPIAGPAGALTGVLLAGAVLLGACHEAPAKHVAARTDSLPETASRVPASKPPEHIFESEGDVDYREPRKYDGETATQ